jgi:hypothetical protein
VSKHGHGRSHGGHKKHRSLARERERRGAKPNTLTAGRLAQCPSQKYAFESRAYAVKWARAKASEGLAGLRAYRCPQCPYWHVTSMDAAEREQIRAAREERGDRE